MDGFCWMIGDQVIDYLSYLYTFIFFNQPSLTRK